MLLPEPRSADSSVERSSRTTVQTELQKLNPRRVGARVGDASRSPEKEEEKKPASLLSHLLPMPPIG